MLKAFKSITYRDIFFRTTILIRITYMENQTLLIFYGSRKSHCRVHKSPLMDPIMTRQIQPTTSQPICKNYLNVILAASPASLPSGLFTSGFPTKILHTFPIFRSYYTDSLSKFPSFDQPNDICLVV